MIKPLQPDFRPWENHTTALRALEMHSPFGGWRHHLSPASGGTITRAYCRAIYEESVSRCFILPPLAGEVRRSRIRGGERSEPISRMLIMSYDSESKSRNADFISIARRAIHNPRPEGPLPLERSEHNPPPTGGHNPRGEAPSAYPSEPSEPFEPSEPSHRRCVHSVHRLRCHL